MFVLAVALLLLVGIVAAGAIREAVQDWSAGPGSVGAGPTIPRSGAGVNSFGVQHPISHYTPGTVALHIGLGQLCPHLSVEWEGARRTLGDSDRQRVKALYGVGAGVRVAEWDHLVPRELGGADTIGNIWPMVNHDQDQRKDRLENELHRQVCAHRLDLPEAQQRARTFWVWWGP
jgi:hypothetical protein